MKLSLKLISLCLAVVFLIAGTVMVAFAEGEDGGDGGGDTGVDSGVDTGGDGGETPVDGGETPVDGGETPVDGGETPVDGGETPVDGGETPVDGGETGGGDSTYYYDPDPLYYGDASNYDYNSYDGGSVTGAVSSQTTLYNSSGMTAAEAAPNQWSEITLDEKTVRTGVADFSAIKSNTETADNGDWILYLGYLLLAFSVLGILYFIIATFTQRKADKKAERMERRRPSATVHSAAARMEESERRAAGTAAYPRTSRYTDDTPSHSRRRASKADTGEVYIPRRAAKR